MLDLLILIIVLMWVAGWGFNIGGGLIHLLLLIAIVVLAIRIIRGQSV